MTNKQMQKELERIQNDFVDGAVKRSVEQLTADPCRICCFQSVAGVCYARMIRSDCKICAALKSELEQLQKRQSAK